MSRLERLLRADTPCVAPTDESVLAASALVRPWRHWLGTSADVVLADAAGAQRLPACANVLVVSDLRSLLDECVAETERRLERTTDAAAPQLAESASVFELASVLLAEARSHGLAARHACRLGLEAVLSSHVAAGAVKQLAATLQCHAEGWSEGGAGSSDDCSRIDCVLEALEVVGLSCSCALNVFSVLLFTGRLAERALLGWREEQRRPSGGGDDIGGDGNGGEDACALMRPLLAWLDRQQDSSGGGGGGGGADAAGASVSEAMAAAAAAAGSLWREVGVRPTSWRPEEAEAALVAELGEGGEAVVVLDGLVGEEERAALCAQLTGATAPRAEAPPDARWARTTCDGAGLPHARSWGLRPDVLRRLGASPSGAMREVHARLCRLYPEYTIAHMPRVDAANFPRAAHHGAGGDAGAGGGGAGAGGGDAGVGDGGVPSSNDYACTDFVANAPVSGECFSWHVDADPSSFPPGRWLARYGDYDNGAPGKPLFVSLLLYLDDVWRREWDAETLFVDEASGAGVLVQPRPARVVLMHQDVLHRVSAPSPLARRPRYSLVWKLIFVPRAPDAATPETICRPEWGPPSLIGARRRRPATSAPDPPGAKRACPPSRAAVK